jgi:uncharacterized protein
VLDTNVLISGFLFDGKPRELLRKVISGSTRCSLSEPILHKFAEVLRRPKFGVPYDASQLIVRELKAICEVVTPSLRINAIGNDHDDDRILECAVEAKIDFLVTADKHLLELGSFKGIDIRSPADCLRKLTGR